jgi:hypothetical protein
VDTSLQVAPAIVEGICRVILSATLPFSDKVSMRQVRLAILVGAEYVLISGMTRDHPFANTPQGQHPLPRSGLAVVAHARKYSHSPVSILILPQ